MTENRGRVFGGLLEGQLHQYGVLKTEPREVEQILLSDKQFNSQFCANHLDYTICVHGGAQYYSEKCMTRKVAI